VEFVTRSVAEPLRVDGLMSDRERALEEAEIAAEDTWIVMRRKGRALINRLVVEGDLPLTRRLVWIDDAEGDLAPEYVRGQLPRVGFRTLGWEKLSAGTYRMRMASVHIPDYEPGDEQRHLELFDVPIEVTAEPVVVAPAPAGIDVIPASAGR